MDQQVAKKRTLLSPTTLTATVSAVVAVAPALSRASLSARRPPARLSGWQIPERLRLLPRRVAGAPAGRRHPSPPPSFRHRLLPSRQVSYLR